MRRSENDVKKAFTALYHSAEEMRLKVNEKKTKYMIVKLGELVTHLHHI